jgi:hypothetical protein
VHQRLDSHSVANSHRRAVKPITRIEDFTLNTIFSVAGARTPAIVLLLACVNLSAVPASTNATADTWLWTAHRSSKNGIIHEDPSGNGESTGEGSGLFGIAGEVSPDDIDLDVGPYDGEAGVFVQFVTVTSLLGEYCWGSEPDFPECNNVMIMTVVEWQTIEAGGAGQGADIKILDEFGLSASGTGCNISANSNSFFMPSGDPNYKKLRDRLEKNYASDANSAGDHSTPDTSGGTIGTGAFQGGVTDANGNGTEDAAEDGGETTENMLDPGAPGSKVVSPGGGSHYAWISWNYCAGDSAVGGGVY